MFDKIDEKILNLLQIDAGLSVGTISDKVGISKSSCWRRIQSLEENGVIQQRITVLDPEKVGLNLMVFVSIKTNQHSQVWSENFKQRVETIPEVMEVHRMGGEVDYLLKIMVKDIKAYDLVYQKLISINLSEVTAGFVMETIKMSYQLPV